ncbi:putative oXIDOREDUCTASE [Mycobacterium ulcerans str. Harvey]|uniref:OXIDOREDUCTASE n=1 Tax=Mycobacterium ulcerans str. Harvey TaxID=1299332 RepID=A0ABN0R0A5_MYCUL|nr:putative oXIDOREDUCTASE [Mycobacterium ulcerans str. Harvey]
MRLGLVAEKLGDESTPAVAAPAGLRGSLQVRHVDAGSCNGCEVEISGAFGPVYDAERVGRGWWPRRGTRMRCWSPGW